jgi:hypothetical protein
VSDGSLDHRRQIVPAHEAEEVVHEPGDVLRRRRDEHGVQRVVRCATDPVLPCAQLARSVRARGVLHEELVDREQIARGQHPAVRGERDRLLHSDDVPKHGPGGDVGLFELEFGAGEPPLRDPEALDPGGGDRRGSPFTGPAGLELPEEGTGSRPISVVIDSCDAAASLVPARPLGSVRYSADR